MPTEAADRSGLPAGTAGGPCGNTCVRPVDVGAVLKARAHRAPADVVLEVEDAFCPWNAGSWRPAGDTEGDGCSRTTGGADLSFSVRELGRHSPYGSRGRRISTASPPARRRGPGRRGGRGRQRRRGRRRGAGRPGQGFWQVGHQKRLRAARGAVRTVSPQRWHGWWVRR
ncbi:sterol carrier protein domain-containing protein [Streptomyces sp. NPDC048734]|uniref:sterol carrier protein domain-containing protein n=1 Tax=Streptomyces sp. NPDC048734 TaxID=3365590 RepID=UPI003714AF2E